MGRDMRTDAQCIPQCCSQDENLGLAMALGWIGSRDTHVLPTNTGLDLADPVDLIRFMCRQRPSY